MNILTAINILAGSIGRPDMISTRVERVISIHPCAKICTHDVHSDEAKKQFDEMGEKSILKRKSLFEKPGLSMGEEKALTAKKTRPSVATPMRPTPRLKGASKRKTLVSSPPRGRRSSKATSTLPAVALSPAAAAGLFSKKKPRGRELSE